MTKTIRVTAKDIKNGKKADPFLCPVALAMRRIFKTAVIYSDSFDTDEISLWPLPYNVYKWIERFDHGGTVKPFSFKIKL
jgi:hypothetical protein